MKKALSLSLLVVVAVFSLACDSGTEFGYPKDAKVVVTAERQIAASRNPSVRVFAADFSLKSDDSGSHILTFTCPCFLGGQHKVEDYTPVVDVLSQEVITAKLLPDVAYNVSERRLDNGERRSYYFPMKK